MPGAILRAMRLRTTERARSLMVPAAVLGAILVLDQGTKLIVELNLNGERDYWVIFPWLSLRPRLNTGGPFGAFSGHGLIFAMASLVVIVGFFLMALRAPFTRLGRAALAAVIGGGASTLIDQFRLGGGVDFLSIGPLIFSVADIAIFVGGALIVFGPSLRRSKERSRDRLGASR